MVIKGILKSIDYDKNTCSVRMPFFENASSGDEVEAQAVFSIQPGMLNGYKEGDVVLLSFEDNDYDTPVVIGKLYLGLQKELADPRGAATIDTLTVKKDASLPVTTQLTFDGNDETVASVDKSAKTYKSINDIIKALQNQGKISDTRNDQLRGELAEKVSTQQGVTSTGFGWTLDDKSWRIQSYDSSHEVPIKDMLRVDNSGVAITGDLKIEGYPKSITYWYRVTDAAERPDQPTEEDHEGWLQTYNWVSGKHV